MDQPNYMYIIDWCLADIIYFVDNLIDLKLHCAISDIFVLAHQCQNDLELWDHVSLSLFGYP